MPGLVVPGIHVFSRLATSKTWMAGTKPGHDAEGWCAFGVELGKTYPEPIIAHRLGRERALQAYARIRAR